jgi:hypothetical protein
MFGHSFLNDELIHVVPALEPQDITSTTTYSDIIGLKEYFGVEFLVYFGNIAGDTIAMTVEECDDISASNTTAIAFSYRESSATGTDSMGARADATTSGVTVAATDDDKVFLVDVDASELSDGYPYVRVKLDPGGSASAVLIGVIALLLPRYPQASQLSAVD